MSLLSIHFSHDFSFGFSPWPGEYRVFELERLTKVRYDSLDIPSFIKWGAPYSEENTRKVIKRLAKEIEKEYGPESIKLEHTIYVDQFNLDLHSDPVSPYHSIFNVIKEFFYVPEGVEFTKCNHHLMHAYSAFYQSPFDDAIVISLDGGGITEDGITSELFKGYILSKYNNTVKELFSHFLPLCPLYDCIPYLSKDIKGKYTAPGKAMGMAGYNGPNLHIYNKIKKFFNSETPPFEKIDHADGTATIFEDALYNSIISQWHDLVPGELLNFNQSATVMASMQKAFEDVFCEAIKSHVLRYKLPIVLTGGGALNVLNNTRVKHEFDLPVFVPCNPNDTGTAIGGILFYDSPKEPVDLRFNNWDLFDRDKLEDFVKERGAKKYTNTDLIKILREGNIIGVVKGRSECGPRALGNRSIICDPSFPDMKDTLNAKVKYRQWFRPFAPMVIEEESSEYFNWDNSPGPNMSFAAYVKGKYREKLQAITHADFTARIQTVSKQDNPWYHTLLTDMKETGLPVLLNTSFNIKGKPILNTIEDALFVLDNTDLDYVIVEQYLFEKR